MEQEIEYNVVDHLIKMDSDTIITDEIVFIRDFIRFNDWVSSKVRKREVVYTRRYICYLIKNKFIGGKDLTFKMIGEIIGGYDHATVIHHLKSHDDQVTTKDYVYKSVMKETDKLLSKFKKQYHRVK